MAVFTLPLLKDSFNGAALRGARRFGAARDPKGTVRGFNGAALRGARRSKLPPRIARWNVASTGPRSEERGDGGGRFA